VSLLTSATDFQELVALDAAGNCPTGAVCKKEGKFTGKVIVGFGDYCDDSRRSLRELQNGDLVDLPFTGDFTFTPKQEESCGFLDVVCWIITFLKNLLHFIGII